MFHFFVDMSSLKHDLENSQNSTKKRQKLECKLSPIFTDDYYYNVLFQLNIYNCPNVILSCISNFAQGHIIGCKLGDKCKTGNSVMYKKRLKNV